MICKMKIFDSVITGRTHDVQQYLVEGDNPNLKHKDGNSLMCYAIYNNQINIIEMLIQHKVNLNYRTSEGKTYLHLAIRRMKSNRILTLLIQAGVDVNSVNKDKRTALHYASILGNLEACQILINAGALVEIKDMFGLTPIDYASRVYNHLNIVKTLESARLCLVRIPKDNYLMNDGKSPRLDEKIRNERSYLV